MSKELVIEKTNEGTIYTIKNGKYRIVQTGQLTYVVETLFTYTINKGHLWLKKKIIKNEWTRVNKNKSIHSLFYRNVSKSFSTFYTKYDAEDWIKNLKYPIYH